MNNGNNSTQEFSEQGKAASVELSDSYRPMHSHAVDGWALLLVPGSTHDAARLPQEGHAVQDFQRMRRQVGRIHIFAYFIILMCAGPRARGRSRTELV
jgi:hypothetical protein